MIAIAFGISAGRIVQVAKERGWTRHTPPFLNAATAGEAGNTIASGSGALPSNGNGFQSVASETGLPTTELNRQPTDDEDRDVRITLPRRMATTMPISMREIALQVPVAEADAHPDFRDRIAELKCRRREANARATQAVRGKCCRSRGR